MEKLQLVEHRVLWCYIKRTTIHSYSIGSITDCPQDAAASTSILSAGTAMPHRSHTVQHCGTHTSSHNLFETYCESQLPAALPCLALPYTVHAGSPSTTVSLLAAVVKSRVGVGASSSSASGSQSGRSTGIQVPQQQPTLSPSH